MHPLQLPTPQVHYHPTHKVYVTKWGERQKLEILVTTNPSIKVVLLIGHHSKKEEQQKQQPP
jgi:hypothetical protein